LFSINEDHFQLSYKYHQTYLNLEQFVNKQHLFENNLWLLWFVIKSSWLQKFNAHDYDCFTCFVYDITEILFTVALSTIPQTLLKLTKQYYETQNNSLHHVRFNCIWSVLNLLIHILFFTEKGVLYPHCHLYRTYMYVSDQVIYIVHTSLIRSFISYIRLWSGHLYRTYGSHDVHVCTI
jgi:hypothetical protein